MVTPTTYETCRTTLRFLRQQTVCEEIELIIVCPCVEELKPDTEEIDPFWGYQFIALDTLASNGTAIAAGIRAAKAPIVVYGEEHSYPTPEWAARLIARHQEPYAAVGYAMGNANPNTLTSWAHLYGQFGAVVEPVTPGPATVLGGHHTSYKRALLLDFGEMLAQMMDNECALHIALRARGHALFLENVVSNHVNISQWTSYCLLDYIGQRGFAAARFSAGRWSWSRRLFYAAASPLIPFVRLLRIRGHLIRTGRNKQFAPQIYLQIVPALLCGAWGEALGYLLGEAPTNHQKKIKFELDRYAHITPQDRKALREANA